MADSKGLDPFEAFKQKKAAAEKAKADVAKQDEANKKAGWIDGIGPAEKQDPSKPKGFMKGRYQKKAVNPAELAKLRPGNLEETKLAKAEPTKTEELPPEDERRPSKFSKF
jgi:hypothetical protein